MTSFYLKYRPQKIADLDLTSVREFFGRLLKSDRVHHAYLFAGPKGTGKTSAGRILAKIVNCEAIKRQELREPCNKCGNCLAIMRGGFPDLIEIDAASNRGIDDVRSLRETVALAPFKGRVKVYLIDEVHMLTHEAFNALLKTLEEPPAHVILILATTEPEKVPATVVSRCVQVNFERATSQEVKRSLEKVVAGERLKVEPEVLTQLTKAAEGSFRDAQKLLEQMVMGREKNKLTVEQVRKDLGRGMKELIRKWLTLAVAGEVKLALEELNRLDKAGVVWKEVVVESVELVREALFYKLGLGKKGGEGELVRLEVEELKELVRRLLQAGRELREAVVPQLPLELLTVEWGARGAG
ncbi:MAG: DNA polymerase III subunit gamma/tau, partial [Candidatus Chisholmbacteria bacterium]|nr:DNA polymerase III subunit gamma/tau [Candidatus Chisholmbacteria bacterium]